MSAQQQQIPQVESPILPDEMGLEDMMRVMDVATSLRREQELVEREFNIDKAKQLLREKLMNTAALTGEDLSEAQIEAAVDWYYNNLHEFQEPPRSFTWYLAQLYVRRNLVLSILIPILFAIITIWSLWLAPFAPFSSANKQRHRLVSISEKIDGIATSASAVVGSETVRAEIDSLENEAKIAFDNKDEKRLREIEQRLALIDHRAGQQFTVTVISGENQRSGFERLYDNDFADDKSAKLSGYYLIVEARTDDGKIIKQRIHNDETDKYSMVGRWAEKVPKAVYDRLASDKKEDGVLNETTFATKKRGQLELKIEMLDAFNLPVRRSAQITEW